MSNSPEPDAADHLRARRAKLDALIDSGEYPYRRGFDRTHMVGDVAATFGSLPPATETDLSVRLAGRLIRMRRQGKLVFGDLVDSTGKIQLLAQENRLGERFRRLDQLDLGDWIGVWGQVMTTRRGELSVALDGYEIVSKCLRPLPEKWRGLRDVESRYRQRYLDLISNPEARRVLQTRFELLEFIRSWLGQRDFLEVETPMLQPIHGGALARPFKTYHEALGMTLYLRVAPELYLKRLLVGGFERIFEINRSFRNEGISVRHNPEFTMLELYQAFGDYLKMAELLEHLVSAASVETNGTRRVPYQEHEIDLEPPFRRVRMVDLVRNAGVDVEGDLAAEADRVGVAVDPRWSWGKILVEIYEKRVERTLIQPTFVLDYPVEMSPLARRHDEDPRFTEHLDLVIAGMEIGVAYSELTDPVEQRRRFDAQAAGRDDESHQLDEDFLKALEYGMPPAGGLGMGVDRLAMILTDQNSIREVIAFPALRPESGLGAELGDTGESNARSVASGGTSQEGARLEGAQPGQERDSPQEEEQREAAPGEEVSPRAAERHAPIPELLVVGTGRVAAALVGLAEAAGFHVRVAAGPEAPRVGEFEGADEIIVTREPKEVEAIRPGANTYVVICSEIQEFAQEVLMCLMDSQVPYLGMMCNKRKTPEIYEQLNQEGFSREQVGRVHTPVGLDLGSKTPEEIALSVLAEIVAVRRGALRGRTPQPLKG
ncbi:MAG: lysine--tRNA ligase [Actinomycetota bacterium]|nr:lysine--tRNA ligase [Actinomycetota bacterium]